jgi:thymidylate synthase ThyX
VVITATEWANFFRLRDHEDAEPHFQDLAKLMRREYNASTPVKRRYHRPFVDDDVPNGEVRWFDVFNQDLDKCSVARCSRVSYMKQGRVPTLEEDLEQFNRLVGGSGFGHWSPHEHVGWASMMCGESIKRYQGNFVGWAQYRKMFLNENLTNE